MLSQIEKRLEKKKAAQSPKPWTGNLPGKDEAPKPNYHAKGIKTRGAPPPGFRNYGHTAKPTEPAKKPAASRSAPGSKVMGARVDPQLYAALERFKQEKNLPSLREALTLAAAERLGVR